MGKYTRITNKASWSAANMQRALDEIAKGAKIRNVAQRFNIPRSTLHDRVKGRRQIASTLGRKPVFSEDAEKELANQIVKLSKLYYGVTLNAFDYAKANNIGTPFSQTKEQAGKDWASGFMMRNNISLRKPEGRSLNRITAFNREEMDILWTNLSNVMDKYKFTPQNVYNVDETGITTVQRPGRILAQKGQKVVGFATSGERGKTTTVVCAFNASGNYVPPCFIFARKRMSPELQRNGPPGASYFCSDNGWMNEDLFVQWLKHFKSFANCSKEQPTLLIMDNHVSHCTLEAYNFCRDSGIVVLTLPLTAQIRFSHYTFLFIIPSRSHTIVSVINT